MLLMRLNKEQRVNDIIYKSLIEKIKTQFGTVKVLAEKNNCVYNTIINTLSNKHFIKIDKNGEIIVKKRVLNSKLNTCLNGQLENIIECILNGKPYSIL